MDLREITVNPKSMKAFRKNEEIRKKLNDNHEDDLFGNKAATGGGGQFNLLGGDSDDSSGSEVRYDYDDTFFFPCLIHVS